MNQFFSSLIVVDNDQAQPRDDNDPRRFLAWARPTLESTARRSGRIISQLTAMSLTFNVSRSSGGCRFRDSRCCRRVRKHIKECNITDKDDVCLSYYTTAKEKVAAWIRLGQYARPLHGRHHRPRHQPGFQAQAGRQDRAQYVLYNGPAKVRQL